MQPVKSVANFSSNIFEYSCPELVEGFKRFYTIFKRFISIFKRFRTFFARFRPPFSCLFYPNPTNQPAHPHFYPPTVGLLPKSTSHRKKTSKNPNFPYNFSLSLLSSYVLSLLSSKKVAGPSLTLLMCICSPKAPFSTATPCLAISSPTFS